MKNIGFILCVTACISCGFLKTTRFDPQAKYSAEELRTDLLVLDKVLKANHPSLYWYTPRDSVSELFSATYNSLTDSLTEHHFRKKVSWLIDKIRCGHTVVRASKNYSDNYSRQNISFLPIYLKVWDDSAVVVNNVSRTDSLIKRGTIITRINGVRIKNIIDSISNLISADGYTKVLKYQLMSFNFPAYYYNSYGQDSSYRVEYLDSLGNTKEQVFRRLQTKDTILQKKELAIPLGITRKQVRQLNLLSNRNLQIDTASNTAIVAVNTFSRGKLIRFFKKTFREIHQKNIKNLILDLRLNSGGSVIACTRLSQYLVDKPFNIADTVATNSRSLKYKKYLKPWILYWLSMNLSGKRHKDGKIHFQYFERHFFKPKDKDHFDGNIYVLTGGFTFSAATIVASNLKGQSNVTIIGEETGGGAYGNSAMLITNIILPKSKLRISLPLYRMVLNDKRPKNGRGIFPDIEVKPSSVHIKRNIDAKLEKALELIKEKEHALY